LNHPARKKAHRYIERVLDEYTRRGERRLPTTRTLARYAGVSDKTMSAALKEVARTGRIESIPGKGILITTHAAPGAMSVPSPRSGWERIKTNMEKDIIEGVFDSASPFPSCAKKSLASLAK